MTGIFTQNIKNKFIEEFVTDVSSNGSNYYVAFGKFFEWPEDTNPPAPNSSIKESQYNINRDFLFGKKVLPDNVSYIAKRKNWTSGTVYDYFDHTDPYIYDRQYYIINSNNRVYKCLFNNYGAASTVEPNLTINNGDFNTADGYKWKYLFTVNSAKGKLFSTDEYFPIVPDQAVVQFAESGAIHVIKVDASGNNYINANGSIDSLVSNNVFKIANSNASSISGAYTKSTFYIYSGSGTGGISTITDYVVNSSGKFVFTNNAIRNIDSTSLYRIDPQVYISGDGTDAKAIATVNALSGQITTIEVVNRGFDYTYADVTIISNTEFGSSAAAHTIISPPGGHGSDPVTELGCETLGVSVVTNLNDNIPNWLKYRQVSLVYNPKASANNKLYQENTFNQLLNFGIVSAPSLFDESEVVQGINSKATATVAYMNTSSLYVIGETGTFQPFETLVSLTSGKIVIVSNINNKDLVPYSSEVFYYKNLEPISRQGIASEAVKLYFNF
jgi:hypothetical protein